MIKELLSSNLKLAIQEKTPVIKNVIRQVYTKINKFEKENHKGVTDVEALDLIFKELKEVNVTLEHATGDLAIEVKKQQEYLMLFDKYRPKAMTIEEIKNYLLDILNTTGVEKSMKSMKYLILIFKEKNPGQNMKIVSGIIKKLLTS